MECQQIPRKGQARGLTTRVSDRVPLEEEHSCDALCISSLKQLEYKSEQELDRTGTAKRLSRTISFGTNVTSSV